MQHNRRLNAHKRRIPKGVPAYIEGIPLTMGDISHPEAELCKPKRRKILTNGCVVCIFIWEKLFSEKGTAYDQNI